MENHGSSRPSQTSPTPFKGLLIWSAVVIVVGAFIAMTSALGIKNAWAGFLFLFYWGGIDQVQVNRLLPNMVGALTGLAISYLLWLLPAQLGGIGVAICLGIIGLSIYCLIMDWLPVAINLMTMLFLTVATVPQIQAGFDVADLFMSLTLGVVFFGSLAWIGVLLERRKLAARA